jgi:rhodanese-related sulfurtransferase
MAARTQRASAFRTTAGAPIVSPTQTPTIRPDMTMEQILAIVPAAQRALFQRYHVGGCSSCGFQPTDTLAQLCKERNILDVNEVIQTILRAHELDQRVQVEPREVKAWLDAGDDFSFIDVRTPEELAIARIPGAEPLDYTNPAKYMELPKDRRIVFSCRSGVRSLDVASYFLGHGFTNVHSMRGGILAWSREIDPSIPQY